VSEENLTTLAGEIVSCTQSGATVRLDNGDVGLLPAGSPSEQTWRVGLRGRFRIESDRSAEKLILSWVAADSLHEFDREFDRLHHALKKHHPATLRQAAPHDPLEEERLRHWVLDVDETVARLRKHRARRLNEQI